MLFFFNNFSIFGTLLSILKNIKKNSGKAIKLSLLCVFSQNMTSWVLASTAALYWRVEGDASRSIDCLRLALTTAPPDVQVSDGLQGEVPLKIVYGGCTAKNRKMPKC